MTDFQERVKRIIYPNGNLATNPMVHSMVDKEQQVVVESISQLVKEEILEKILNISSIPKEEFTVIDKESAINNKIFELQRELE